MSDIELDEVDSTNEYIKRNINTLDHFDVVRSKYQTSGKGRNGHVWDSEKDKNLLLSILLKDFNQPNKLHQLTQVVAISIIKTLKEYNIDSLVKWPNDIYVDDLKICGILIEAIYQERLQGVVVGIGLNVNGTDKLYQSMSLVNNNIYDITEIKDILITKFKHYYHQYLSGDYQQILAYMNKHAYLKNKYIEFDKYGKVLFESLNEDGTLTIKDINNNYFNIFINQISLHQ